MVELIFDVNIPARFIEGRLGLSRSKSNERNDKCKQDLFYITISLSSRAAVGR